MLVTHTILSPQKIFTSYETMCELFRETQLKLLELTLWERLLKTFNKLVIKMAILKATDLFLKTINTITTKMSFGLQ